VVAQGVVVGAAVVDLGRVLAARRSAPAQVAGHWEFPGGKVEAGESDPDALVRECREELGIEIGVRELLGARPLDSGYQLRVYRAELLYGEPMALQDHDDLRWLYPAELIDNGAMVWLAGDVPFLPLVRAAIERL
jgi:8-oxo-dGTP diphosphatase